MEKTNNITAPASTNVLQNHLSDIFLDNYRTQNRFWQFGKAPESSKGYRTISWARSSIVNYEPADVLLVEGQVPTGTDGNIGLVTVLPIQYGDITKISDVLIEMSRLSIVEKRSRDLSEGAHRVIDKVIQNELLTNGINVRYGGSKTARNQLTADDKISLLDVSVMSTFLSEKGAPEFEGGNYV
ncbi:MAG: hypothetical protein LBG59_02310 [Candidatus Peribacteria bacterium]|jgi:N4-gp56 family major capsid protein|nr:hypothetical protein [Candidatus Peribacteria bacterium]